MEHTDIKTKILFMVPVAVAIMLLFFVYKIEFKGGFSPVELQVMNFEYRPLSIPEKQAAVPVKILKGPLYPDDASDTGHEMSGRHDAAITTGDLEVSLIIISGGSKMAIIQGVLVKEGDIVDDKKVVKIEPGRVLLKNKIKQWVNVTK